MSQRIETSPCHPLLISGPSGIGKSYLAQYLETHYLCARVVPTTTRTPRDNEQSGVDYHFITPSEYEERVTNGQMFMSNNFFQAYYGFESSSVDGLIQNGLVPVTEIYTPKITEFCQAYPLSRAIYLIPETEALLRHRMESRGDSTDQVEYRLAGGREELELYRQQYNPYYDVEYLARSNNFLQNVLDIEKRYNLIRRLT